MLIRDKKSKIQMVQAFPWVHNSSACLGIRRPRKTNTTGSLETEEPRELLRWNGIWQGSRRARGLEAHTKKNGKQLSWALGTHWECGVMGTSEGYLARNGKQQQKRAAATHPKGWAGGSPGMSHWRRHTVLRRRSRFVQNELFSVGSASEIQAHSFTPIS